MAFSQTPAKLDSDYSASNTHADVKREAHFLEKIHLKT